jgi:hypothetical protein
MDKEDTTFEPVDPRRRAELQAMAAPPAFAPTQTYAQMLGMAQGGAPAPMSTGMTSVVDQGPAQTLAQMQRPAQSPQELEARKQGWQTVAEKLQDPNLLRALGFAGAAMMQPGGSLGHGLASGLTAFQSGEYAQKEREIQAQEQARKERESQVGIEATQAGTELRRAQLPGVQAESQVAVGTLQTKIQKEQTQLKTDQEKLRRAIETGKTADLVDQFERRKAAVAASLGDAQIAQQIMAQYDNLIAQASQHGAAARRGTAAARVEEQEAEFLEGLSPEKRAEYFTRRGGGGATATLPQQKAAWEDLYDKLKAEKPDDPQIKNVTRAQFVRDRLTEAEEKNTMATLSRLLQFVEPGSPEETAIREQLANVLGRRERGPAPGVEKPGTAKGAGGPWQPAGPNMEFRIRADGTREVRRKSMLQQ